MAMFGFSGAGRSNQRRPKGGLETPRPWRDLTADAVASVPGRLGVYEIAASGPSGCEVVLIGFAGVHELFGLRSALDRELNRQPPAWFRFEPTDGYLSRWEELLTAHMARCGALPVGNADHLQQVGTLTLDG